MITTGIFFKNFKLKKNQLNIKKKLKSLINDEDFVINSLRNNYKDNFKKKNLKIYNNYKDVRIIGMGGSSLGTQAIYNFLKHKIKKKVTFFENINFKKKYKSKKLNIIVSKSGNTLETIANLNTQINTIDKNIFITENSSNYLRKLAYKLKSEVIEHKNFIGGRFSVLSEVGMLPAQLMGLNEHKFKKFNDLVSKKTFLNNLFHNTLSTYQLIKLKKFNSIILNYDKNSDDLFKWYQQLVSESLGKNSKGILPVISTMPKDNHSILQLYLSGFNSNFFTFYIVEEKNSAYLNSKLIFDNFDFLRGKNVFNILNSQRIATQNIFRRKNIPFRSFYIKKRNEETMGELFSFFTLEVILLSKLLKINPLNQPEVELVKKETFNILRR